MEEDEREKAEEGVFASDESTEDAENTEQGETVVVDNAAQEEESLEEETVPEDAAQKEEVLEEENVLEDVAASEDTADSGENEAVSSSDEDEEEEEIVTGMEKEFGDKDSEEEEVQPEDN